MERFNFIEYHHTRDFSRKINATFEFVRQNIKSLSKSILFIAGPPVLGGSLLMGSFFSDMMMLSQAVGGGEANAMAEQFTSVSFWLQMLLMFVLLIVSTVATIATINNYILLYEEKQSNQIEVQEVWIRVRQTFWMYFGTMFLFGFLAMVVYVILLIPMVLLASISPFLIFIGVLGLMCVVVYLAVSVSLTFFVRAYERAGFFDALGRSFSLVKGKWWSTFGLTMVLSMIVSITSYIFLIPWYVIFFINMMHSVETTTPFEMSPTLSVISLIFFTLYYLAHMFLYALPNVGIAFQYFNLVEMKESRGLIKSIETIGQDIPAPEANDEHY